MKLRPTQFGVHESTASPRQHASRLAGYPASQESARVLERPRNRIEGRTSAAHGVEFIEVLPTDSADVATAEKRKQTAHSVSVEDTNSARANPDARSAASHGSAGPVSPKADAEFEPLLDVVEAARLLRIHPKTLQKLARVAKVPAFRIGRFWRDRASDLEMWLRSGANSDRQPIDRVDFT